MRGHGFKVLGLCFLAALGLMAFNAAVAQAGAEWEIKTDPNGATKLVSQLPNGLEQITGKLDATTNNELLVLGLGLTIKCNKILVEEAHIIAGGGAAHLTYDECIVLGSSAVCKVLPILVSAKILLILHGGEIFGLIEPKVGNSFTDIEIDNTTPEEPECNVATEGEPQLVTGSVLTLIPTTLAVEQLISVYSNQALLNDELKYGNQTAHLHGAVEVKLSGADAGSLWAAEHKTL